MHDLKENRENEEGKEGPSTFGTHPSEGRLQNGTQLTISEIGDGVDDGRFREKRVKKQRISKGRKTPSSFLG